MTNQSDKKSWLVIFLKNNPTEAVLHSTVRGFGCTEPPPLLIPDLWKCFLDEPLELRRGPVCWYRGRRSGRGLRYSWEWVWEVEQHGRCSLSLLKPASWYPSCLYSISAPITPIHLRPIYGGWMHSSTSGVLQFGAWTKSTVANLE